MRPLILAATLLALALPALAGPLAPPAQARHLTPPAQAGHLTPPADAGHLTPPADAGHLTPPADAGQLIAPAQAGQLIKPRTLLDRPQRDFGAAAREQSRQGAQEFELNRRLRTDQHERRIDAQGDALTNDARARQARRLSPLRR